MTLSISFLKSIWNFSFSFLSHKFVMDYCWFSSFDLKPKMKLAKDYCLNT